MKKSLIALAFGTLALGMAEFAMMGILPYVASDFGISISEAGHLISALHRYWFLHGRSHSSICLWHWFR